MALRALTDPADPTALAAYLEEQATLPDAATGRWHGFAVVADGVLAGEVGWFLQQDPPGEADLGFVLHPDHRGRGLATAAARVLLARAVGLGVVAVTGHCDAANPASARVLERVGLVAVPSAEPGVLAFRWEAR